MRKQHKQKVISYGPAEFRRYIIEDIELGYWTGSNWIHEPKLAMIFCKMPDAATELNRINEAEMSKKPCKEFTAMVSIRVRGDQEEINKLTLHELQAYLGSAIEMQINFPGPSDELTTNVSIDWQDLTPLN